MSAGATALPAAASRRREEAGRWEWGKGNQLRLRRKGAAESASLRARIIGADADGLVLAVSAEQEGQKPKRRQMTLSGRWEVVSGNRLSFVVEGTDAGDEGRIVFEGAWELGRDQQLLARLPLGPGARRQGLLRLAGSWAIAENGRLHYLLENGQALRFRAALQTPSVLARAGEVRYQIGLQVGKRRASRNVSVFGQWKLGRDLSVELEMGRGPRSRTVSFATGYRVSDASTVTVGLSAADGSTLGIEVVFSRKASGGEWFARYEKSSREAVAEAGWSLRW